MLKENCVWLCFVFVIHTCEHHVFSKEVWKILPSYEELRRGAIGRGKEAEVMSIRCHVN